MKQTLPIKDVFLWFFYKIPSVLLSIRLTTKSVHSFTSSLYHFIWHICHFASCLMFIRCVFASLWSWVRVYPSKVPLQNIFIIISEEFFYLRLSIPDAFLGATKRLYNWLCPSVGRSVGRLVCRLRIRSTIHTSHLLTYLALFTYINIAQRST